MNNGPPNFGKMMCMIIKYSVCKYSLFSVCLFVCWCCFNQFHDIAPKRRLAEDQIEIPRKNSPKSKNSLEAKISRTFRAWILRHFRPSSLNMSLASRACQILSLAGHVKISLWRALNAQVSSLNLQLSVTKKKWHVNTCKKIKKKIEHVEEQLLLT